jgi:hypothetical protein
MIYLGIDPDTTHMGIASLRNGSLKVALARVPDGPVLQRLVAMTRTSYIYEEILSVLPSWPLSKGEQIVAAVEMQHARPKDRRPDDIVKLATAAGIALCAVSGYVGVSGTILTPIPSEWKGQVPKGEKQNRIVQEIGIAHFARALKWADIPIPPDLGNFTTEFTGLASHVIDAAGLCVWAMRGQSVRDAVAKIKETP